jgi:hypothetical protein
VGATGGLAGVTAGLTKVLGMAEMLFGRVGAGWDAKTGAAGAVMDGLVAIR